MIVKSCVLGGISSCEEGKGISWQIIAWEQGKGMDILGKKTKILKRQEWGRISSFMERYTPLVDQ